MASINSDKRLLSGSFWITLSEVVSAAASLGTAILAARVLAPEDFGQMGIIFLIIGILDAFTRTGFEQALIQKKDDPTDYLNVAFTWHLGRGLIIGALMLLAAPWLAAFFDEPVLSAAIAVSGLYIIFVGAKNPGEIFFTRNLNFRTVCMLNVARALLKLLVAVPAIFIFQNVWALVIAFIAGAVLTCVISYVAHPFRPRLKWDWPKAKELIRFGKWIFGLTILGFLMNKGDDLFISKYFGAMALGFYYYAFEISNWPATKITHVLSRVSFPTYSRLQSEPEELRRAFLNVMKASLLITGPLSVVIFVLVPYLVYYVIGEDWAPIIALVQILVVAGAIRSFQALAGALFQACGRPELDFKMNLPRAIALGVLIWPVSALVGLEGAALVVVIALLVSLPIWFYGVRRLVNVTFGDVLQVNGLTLVASGLLFVILSGMDALLYGALPTWYGALLTVIGGLATWALVMYVLEKVSPFRIYSEIARLKAAIKKS